MSDFEQARDEKLEQIRIGKQDESTAIRMANWAHDWARAYTLKHDSIVLGLVEAARKLSVIEVSVKNGPEMCASELVVNRDEWETRCRALDEVLAAYEKEIEGKE